MQVLDLSKFNDNIGGRWPGSLSQHREFNVILLFVISKSFGTGVRGGGGVGDAATLYQQDHLRYLQWE